LEIDFQSTSMFDYNLFTTGFGQKSCNQQIQETLVISTNPELELIEVNYSLDFYCFLEINPTFAIRN
jgi:hypothetical protein